MILQLFLAIFPLLLSFGLTFLLIPNIIAMAHAYRIFDVPDGQLKQHSRPIPYLGGTAVYLGFSVALGWFLPIALWAQLIPLYLLLTALWLLGLWDDLRILSPLHKFIGQAGAVTLSFGVNIWLQGGLEQYGVLTLLGVALWCLTVINAFNLIDIMDGLTTTVALMYCLALLLILIFVPKLQLTLFYFLGSLVGALLAFLSYNYPPAKIYLGDSGSLMLGGICAYLPILIPWQSYNQIGLIAPIVLLAVPLLELAGLITLRTYKKIPVYLGSPDHFAHYLQRKAWSRAQILGFMVACMSFLGLVALGAFLNLISLPVLLLLGICFNFIWVRLIFI